MSFAQYKAYNDTTDRIGYNSASEKLPFHPWYALDHEKITSGIREPCLSLLDLTSNHSASDTEIVNLNAALNTAKTVSRNKKLHIAFLGDQGIGKSALICSLFDRDLVQVSSSSSACTAYPTIIAYKDRASDDTAESDVRIQYLNDNEIGDCAREQGRRYRGGFPRKRQSSNARLEAISPQESVEMTEDDEEEEEEESEEDRKHTMDSARTARDFFRIIFDSERNSKRKKQLEQFLDFEDIENDTFAETCVQYARERLASIDVKDGFRQHNAVPEEDLYALREEAEDVWPLVKSVQLETGHRLLRNGLCFLDLPGKVRVVAQLECC